MRITKIYKAGREQPLISPSSPLKTQPSVNKIIIPCTATEGNEVEQHQNKMPVGRTNIKQLHHFLRNQIIVVKQKERLISNQDIGRLGSITELNRSITKAICLKAGDNLQSAIEGSVPTISLPKIEREEYQRIFTDSNISRHEQATATAEQTKAKKRQTAMPRHNYGTHKRLSTLCSRMSSIENSPLISSASRHITRTRQAVREYLTESKAKTKENHSTDVVIDFSLYRQCPQLNRISLNLAMEVSKGSKYSK